MAGNKTLARAKDTKNDEFYTQLSDIEKELKYYKEYFKGKTIFCNCDDPETSNFWLYFELNFSVFGLKKLVATHYEKEKPSYKLELVKDENEDGKIDKLDIVKTKLRQNGDFRSPECIEILKEADIVITNPPFSLFIEYLLQLIEYNKKFIIIGNLNATHYKEIFPLIRDNKIWLGNTNFNGGATYFIGSKDLYDPKKMSNPKHAYIKDGKLYWRVNGVRWFTNIETKVRSEELILYKHYTPEEYPSYFNYDGIDVNNINDIPIDYMGNMGVPDSFLQRYNPNQFEIVGLGCGNMAKEIGVEKNHRGRTDIAFYDKNGTPKCPYSRIIVRRKQNAN